MILGSYNNPIPFMQYTEVERGLTYSTDGIVKYRCIKNGNPELITDIRYFIKEVD